MAKAESMKARQPVFRLTPQQKLPLNLLQLRRKPRRKKELRRKKQSKAFKLNAALWGETLHLPLILFDQSKQDPIVQSV